MGPCLKKMNAREGLFRERLSDTPAQAALLVRSAVRFVRFLWQRMESGLRRGDDPVSALLGNLLVARGEKHGDRRKLPDLHDLQVQVCAWHCRNGEVGTWFHGWSQLGRAFVWYPW